MRSVTTGDAPDPPAGNSLMLMRACPPGQGQPSPPVPWNWATTSDAGPEDAHNPCQKGTARAGRHTLTEDTGWHRATRSDRTPAPPTIHRHELYCFSGAYPIMANYFGFILYEECKMICHHQGNERSDVKIPELVYTKSLQPSLHGLTRHQDNL
jgi:hypothetical protein